MVPVRYGRQARNGCGVQPVVRREVGVGALTGTTRDLGVRCVGDGVSRRRVSRG